MKSCKPLMGLCPMGKFVFSHEDAVRYKNLLRERLDEWGVRYVDLDGVLEDGIVRDQSHVDAAVAHFRKAEVQCLFLPHCNFGTEGAVGMIARELDVPTLLWGPRDEAPLPDGTRLRDTLCGLFASSKVLHKLGVRYAYIENCRVDEPALREGVDTFVRAVNAAEVLTRGARIGHIGQRIDFFYSTIVNESELFERFNVQVIPIDMVEFIGRVKSRAAQGHAGYEDEVRRLREEWHIEKLGDQPLINVLAMRDETLGLGDDLGLDGFAVQSFMSLIDATGAYGALADGYVSERYAFGMESDINGALSALILRRAAHDHEPAFLADLTIRHPENDNAVLLWHGGSPLSFRDESEKPRLGKHWILPSPLSGQTHFKMKEGAITCARFDGDRGSYKLAVGEGETVPGPRTLNNYVWIEVADWPRWERALIEGPFMHHVGISYARYGKALRQMTKFVQGLDLVDLDG